MSMTAVLYRTKTFRKKYECEIKSSASDQTWEVIAVTRTKRQAFKITQYSCLAVLLAALAPGSAAQAEQAHIRILVVYTPEGRDQLENNPAHSDVGNNDIDHVGGNLFGMNEALENSGLGGDYAFVLAGIGDIQYDENGTDTPGVVTESHGDLTVAASEINDNSDIVGYSNKSLDQMRNEAEADVVIVVGSTIPSTGDCCGEASGIPNTEALDSGEFVVIVRVFSKDGGLWSHEIGHLAGLTHSNETGGVDPEGRGYVILDSSGNPDVGTVMASGGVGCISPCQRRLVFSSPNNVIIDQQGNSHPAGDSTHSATETLQKTLPAMVGYAADIVGSAPGNGGGMAEMVQCNGSVANFSVSWWAGGGPFVSYLEVEQKSLSGVWGPYFEGDGQCLLYGSSADRVYFRVRAVNAAGESDWTSFYGDNFCSSGGQAE